MKSAATLALQFCLKVARPLARMLIKSGVGYPAFAQAMKREFLAAAQAELQARGMPQTDSAVSLLSGVHRRDIRQLTRPTPQPSAGTNTDTDVSSDTEADPGRPLSLAAEVVGRWLHDTPFLDSQGHPRLLSRSGSDDSFDALVARVSSDVRPRAVLDELLRLGGVAEEAGGVRLLAEEFTPRPGMEEVAWLCGDNLRDALSAGTANLLTENKFLEQSIFVDELSQTSVERLHEVSRRAWRQAFKMVMQEAQDRFHADAQEHAPEARAKRARFGVYFYSEAMIEGKKQ